MAKVLSPVGGQKTVTTPGTAVPVVATETRCIQVVFQAMKTNTNDIYIGDLSVDYVTSQQVVLDAGESLSVLSSVEDGLYVDLNEWYVDADTAGEGVTFVYLV